MEYRRAFIENSFIFITVITSKRRAVLIKNIELLRKSFTHAKKFYPFEIKAVVILPDHMHMIIKPSNINDYPTIIRLLKSYFSKHINLDSIDGYKVSKSKLDKKEKDI